MTVTHEASPVRARFAAGLWGALVTVAMLAPWGHDHSHPWRGLPWLPDPDKVGHGVLFFVLAWLISRALKAAGHRRPVLTATLVTIVYGTALEMAQNWVPLRSTDPWDVVANAAGALAFATIATLRGWRSPDLY